MELQRSRSCLAIFRRYMELQGSHCYSSYWILYKASVLGPGEPCRLGTPFAYLAWNPATRGGKAHFMYAVTVENPRPEQGRQIHLHNNIWKLTTRGGKEHFICAVTQETPRPELGRHTHWHTNLWNFATPVVRHSSCKQLLRKPRDPRGKGTCISIVIAENSRCGQARHTHLRSYRGNLRNVCACVL
jgi:hypothetical protein